MCSLKCVSWCIKGMKKKKIITLDHCIQTIFNLLSNTSINRVDENLYCFLLYKTKMNRCFPEIYIPFNKLYFKSIPFSGSDV